VEGTRRCLFEGTPTVRTTVWRDWHLHRAPPIYNTHDKIPCCPRYIWVNNQQERAPLSRTLEKLIFVQLVNKIVSILGNMNIHFLIHKRSPLDPILNHFKSSSHAISSRSLLVLQSYSWLDPAKALLPTAFPTKMNCAIPSRHVELLLSDNSNSNCRRYRL